MSSDDDNSSKSFSDVAEQMDTHDKSAVENDSTPNDNLLNNNSDKDCLHENGSCDKQETMKAAIESKTTSCDTNKKSLNSAKIGNAGSDTDSSAGVGRQLNESGTASKLKKDDTVDKLSSKSSAEEHSSCSDKKSEKMDVGETEVEPEEGKVDDPSSANISSSSSSCSSVSSSSSLSSSSSSLLSSLRLSTRSAQKQNIQQSGQNQVQGRATRLSQNPDFAAKHRKFLNRVHDAISKTEDQIDDSSSNCDSPVLASRDRSNSSDDSGKNFSRVSRSEKRRRESVSSGRLVNDVDNEEPNVESDSTAADSPKKKKINIKGETSASLKSQLPVLDGSDRYCWRCHRDGNAILCKTCPRVYHLRCTQLETVPQSDWVCPECTAIVYAENTDTRSAAMKSLSLDQLCNLLKYTILRMKAYAGSEWFCKAVDQTQFPEYRNFVVRPMDLTLLEKNIKQKRYGSTEAFLADTKWILHNCVVFNTYQSKLSNIAKALLKICRQEMAEIENCPDCYLNAHTRKDSWFVEVCRRPHIIVWAKLKGFPFWPAKAMRTNNENCVDVRFFGAHDRAWVPVNSVYLYSRNPPAAAKNKKKNNLDECIMEVEQHIKKLRDRFGKFEYASFKTSFDPENELDQLRTLLPAFTSPSSHNIPNRRYSRAIGPVKYVEGSEQSENKQIEIKKEDIDKKEGKNVCTSVKKVLKENKSTFGENNNDIDGETTVIPSDNESIMNKSDDSIDKSTVTPALASGSNAENISGVTVNQKPPSGEPNLVFRGITVKRQLSTVYDGGGGGDNISDTDAARKSNAKKTDDSVVSTKFRRISSDSSIPDCGNLNSSSSISNVKVIKTYQNNKSVNSHTRSEMFKTSKVFVNSVKGKVDIFGKNLETSSESDKADISPSACPESSNSIRFITNSSSIISQDSNGENSSIIDDSNKKVKKSNNFEKDTSSLIVSGEKSDVSGNNSISSCNKINNENHNNNSSSEESSMDLMQPIIIMCDINRTNKNPMSNVVVKQENVSNDENINCDSYKVNNSQVIDENTSKSKDNVEKIVETLSENNQNDVESDCSSKDDSVSEVMVVDKPPPEMIDLDSDKSTELAILPDNSHEEMMPVKPASSLSPSELHNKVMLDSTDENPLVIIDENSDFEQNQQQNEPVPSVLQNSSESSSSSPVSDKDQSSLHQQILKSVLECSSENNSSTSNLEKTVLINRRKSKPVKIRSRSNTSSSEDTVEELKRICEEQEAFRKTNENPSIEEVLDEVSGRFRRKENSNSEDPNVTITLVSDDEPRKPMSKTKEIRPSVALSRDVSLTVIDNTEDHCSSNSINCKDLPTSLEMECVESDTDEPVLVNETRLKPTARKTFPKPSNLPKSDSLKLNKPVKSYSKKDLQITPVVEQHANIAANKVSVARLPTNMSGVDEIKISNTMSMKLQPTSNNNSVKLNGRPSSLSPPSVLPNPTATTNFRNTATTQARVLPLLQPKPLPAAVAIDAPLSGPTSIQLDNCSQKLAQRFRCMLEEMLRDLSAEGSTEAAVKSLQLEMERLQWKHRQELAELKHNTDLIIMEMRASLEAEKQRTVIETKMKCEAEKETAINETKMKQWCALCKKEALFYCCWNTAYCNYPCQQAHWPQHMSVCAQTSRAASETTVTKTTSAPKSMPTGFNGNNTNKTVCYSSPTSNQQVNPPISSKQQHPPTSSNNNNVSLIPLNMPNVSTSNSAYSRLKNSTVISSGQHSGPGNLYYPPGMTVPQNGSTSTTQSHMSQQSDMKLMPPPSQHQTNISYSRMINGKMNTQPHLVSPPPPPPPPTASQLHSYRQLSVSVRPPQYFMIPRGAPAGGFYH